jgi:general stress protein 26
MPDLARNLAAVKDQSTARITTRGRRTGKPHSRPIWFVVDGLTIYLGTLNAQRDWVRNAQKNPDVLLDFGSLRVRGQLATVTDPALEARIRELIAGKYWVAWIGSWFGARPDRTFRVDALEPPGA